MQGCASNGHCNIWLVVSGAWPHSHVVSPCDDLYVQMIEYKT